MITEKDFDFYYIKKRRGRLCSYIMALVAAFMGMHIALIESLVVLSSPEMFSFSGYGYDAYIVITVLILLLSAISIAGAFLIRSSRTAGGIALLLANAPLFVVSIIDSENFFFYSATSLVCVAAAVLALIPLSDGYIKAQIERKRFQHEMNLFVQQRMAQHQTGPAEVPSANMPNSENDPADPQEKDW